MKKEINLSPIISLKSTFTLMLAPPGWGKTTLILNIYEEFNGKIVFISPLKALACEFFKRASHLKGVYSLSSNDSKEDAKKLFIESKKAMLVLTAEKLSDDIIARSSDENILFIFDEFHLFYYWGQSFRPILFEKLMAAANNSAQMLGLTATMDPALLETWKNDFNLAVENMYLLNLGNQKLLNIPTKIYNFSLLSKMVFYRYFFREVFFNDQAKTILFFCRYRRDVEMWLDFSKRRNLNAIGCVGGAVEDFIRDLEENPSPRCIFSTSALSHGVNLPTITQVFIDYPVDNKDFWIQMVGRGGRDGTSFQVFEQEKKSWSSIGNLYHSMLLFIKDLFLLRQNL
ncbi:hypothetical protein A9Q84_07410 [Halobacteriovorax marinus]|uniref:Helicase ATP-binding domain-containing protein n=1 Tax=Halobacteriovorax marinus TaxID=97084 RepID=A0A1Y5FBE3_9BACT|nr:hypothetical protein A9Q84_07410 [Halobacteriovorax marinus]